MERALRRQRLRRTLVAILIWPRMTGFFAWSRRSVFPRVCKPACSNGLRGQLKAPASLPFAKQTVGTQSAAKPITVTNKGTAALTISGITITGAFPGDFAQNSNCGSLAAGASCTINVTFKPTAAGARTATISITDNGGGSPQTVPLSGTGA